MARWLARLSIVLLTAAAPAQVVSVRTARDGIVRVPMEEYVAWVLSGEAGGITEYSALEAIAVAARSYARAHLGRHAAEGFDFCETTHCQDARPGAASLQLRRAAERTADQVIWRDGQLVPGFHHRHCGGRTATPREVWAGERDYGLVSIEDSYCGSAPGSAWRSVLKLPGTDLRVAGRTPSGRVANLRDGPRLIDAEAFHLQVGRTLGWSILRSRFYDLRREGESYVAQGRGQGHGVGLCQTGAAARAHSGHGRDAILRAYFGDIAVGLTHKHAGWIETDTARLRIRTSGAALDEGIPVAAEAALADAERISGLRASQRITVTVYPTIDLYRDLTGSPGFVAATTRGASIRLQPAATLSRAGRLAATLRHEFLHVVIGSRAQRPLPEWFSEGLALWLEQPQAAPAALRPETNRAIESPASEAALRRAYENARGVVAGLVRTHGRERVLASLTLGMPE
jgi:stage II sporulation protein D